MYKYIYMLLGVELLTLVLGLDKQLPFEWLSFPFRSI